MGGGQLPNAATYFVVLKNWKERAGKEHTAQAVVNRFNGQAYAMIQEAQVLVLFLRLFRVWVIRAACSSNWRPQVVGCRGTAKGG